MNLGIKVKLVGSVRMESFTSFLTRGERDAVLRKIGAILKRLTVDNLGFTGPGRPSQWAPLSPRYAKRVKRPEATLDLTGDLLRSLRVGSPDGEGIDVYTDNVYAEAHQNGNPARNLPARPFFPILPDGSPTARTQNILETTAALEIQRQMRELVK